MMMPISLKNAIVSNLQSVNLAADNTSMLGDFANAIAMAVIAEVKNAEIALSATNIDGAMSSVASIMVDGMVGMGMDESNLTSAIASNLGSANLEGEQNLLEAFSGAIADAVVAEVKNARISVSAVNLTPPIIVTVDGMMGLGMMDIRLKNAIVSNLQSAGLAADDTSMLGDFADAIAKAVIDEVKNAMIVIIGTCIFPFPPATPPGPIVVPIAVTNVSIS
jgi:hypothetical protein